MRMNVGSGDLSLNVADLSRTVRSDRTQLIEVVERQPLPHSWRIQGSIESRFRYLLVEVSRELQPRRELARMNFDRCRLQCAGMLTVREQRGRRRDICQVALMARQVCPERVDPRVCEASD